MKAGAGDNGKKDKLNSHFEKLLKKAEDLTSKYIQTVQLQISHQHHRSDFSQKGLDDHTGKSLYLSRVDENENLMNSAEELNEVEAAKANQVMELYNNIKTNTI